MRWSQAQWRLWVLMQMENAAAAYSIPLHFELVGPLRREALEQAFAALMARHEALRTNFILVDGQPRQVVHACMGTHDRARGFIDAVRPGRRGPGMRAAASRRRRRSTWRAIRCCA